MVDEIYQDVEPGQEGELLVRSPLVTQGYYDNPQATKEAFHDDWFCTGDIGILRDGKFYIVDRKKVSRPVLYQTNGQAPYTSPSTSIHTSCFFPSPSVATEDR
jgi:acyl-CoA synthetase (AMP-forming)/AMP-acid ligase II